MTLTGKQKRYLRSQAHHLTPIFQVGKAGVTTEMEKQVEEALVKRELLKVQLLQNTSLTADEAAEIFAESIPCEIVQVIGKVVVLFKASPKEKFQKYSNALKDL